MNTDPAYIQLSQGKVHHTIDVGDKGIVFVDVDDTGNIIGVEILGKTLGEKQFVVSLSAGNTKVYIANDDNSSRFTKDLSTAKIFATRKEAMQAWPTKDPGSFIQVDILPIDKEKK